MDNSRPQDSKQSKGSTSRHREHSDESADKRPADSSASPADVKRQIRRVRSPSAPRARLSNSYKPKFGRRLYRPQDDRFRKPGFAYQKYHHFPPRGYFHWKPYFQPKLHFVPLRERLKEKERYEQRRSGDRKSPPKQDNPTRPFVPRSTSSRDQDMQFIVRQSARNQSHERDHKGGKSKERERSRDGELPLTASQTATRDRAIRQKRSEIDEVYNKECEMFGLVAKMLIAKDPTLERSIQSALQENLRDIGTRCVEGMQRFIDDYDSLH